ncbi:MAG: methyltransferase [Chromatocurvus sp.]
MAAQASTVARPVGAVQSGRGGVREFMLGWRDRLLGSARFQRAAARFPLTRPLARRRARTLFDLSAGFVYSQILFACVRSRLLESLAEGPRSVSAIARDIDLPESAALRLLRGAASLRLVQPAGDDYRLGDLGAVMLGNPSIAAMVNHHERLYADLADPLALLANPGETNLAAYWPYARSANRGAIGEQEVAAYSELMTASQAMLSSDILNAVNLKSAQHLLDVAGGEGVFLSAALARWPHLTGTVMDLPAVAGRAAVRLAESPVAARAASTPVDMFADDWPPGADLISFVRVLHDHDDDPVRDLLSRARAALAPGGRVMVAEPMAQTPGAEPVGDGYFGFYLLAMGSGRPRSAKELTSMLHDAGFAHVRELKTAQPMLVRVLIAEIGDPDVN